MVHSNHRHIGRNLYDIHAVNIHELLVLCHGSTGHAGFLFIFVKEVLECNGGQCFGLTIDFHMLFGFDCLMESVRITTTRHDTSGKFIDNKNLVILYHIILVPEHEIVGAKRQNDIVLNLQVLRVSQVADMEELLYFFDTFCSQHYLFFFFIYQEISVFFDINTHDGIHFAQFSVGGTSLHLSCQHIAGFI